LRKTLESVRGNWREDLCAKERGTRVGGVSRAKIKIRRGENYLATATGRTTSATLWLSAEGGGKKKEFPRGERKGPRHRLGVEKKGENNSQNKEKEI